MQAGHAAQLLFVLGCCMRLCPQPHLQRGRGGKQAAEGVLGNCGHPLPEGKGVGAVIQRLHLQAQRAQQSLNTRRCVYATDGHVQAACQAHLPPGGLHCMGLQTPKAQMGSLEDAPRSSLSSWQHNARQTQCHNLSARRWRTGAKMSKQPSAIKHAPQVALASQVPRLRKPISPPGHHCIAVGCNSLPPPNPQMLSSGSTHVHFTICVTGSPPVMC